jgi:hypothetical protein
MRNFSFRLKQCLQNDSFVVALIFRAIQQVTGASVRSCGKHKSKPNCWRAAKKLTWWSFHQKSELT